MYTIIRYDQEPALSPALIDTDTFCVTRSPFGASAPFQKVQMSDVLAYISDEIIPLNIYNSDGVLTADRTLSLDGFNLNLGGSGAAQIIFSPLGTLALASTEAITIYTPALSFGTPLVQFNGITNQFTTALFVGHGTQFLTVSDTGVITPVAAGTDMNIYNSDGELTAARTVTMGTDALTFTGNADINLSPDGESSWMGLNIGVDSYAGVYNSYYGVSLKQSLNLVTSGLFTGNVFNGISMTCYNDDDVVPAVLFNMSRGTSGAPTVLLNGQVVGEIDFAAYTGDTVDGLPDFRACGFIYGLMEADASSGKAPMALYFDTSDLDGNVLDRMYIGNNGAVALSNDINQIAKTIPTAGGALQAEFTTLNTSLLSNMLVYDIAPESMDKLSQVFARARGTTFTGLTAVGTGDNIGIVSWWGYDGANFIPSFTMGLTVSSVSTGEVDSYFNITPQSNATGINISSAGMITLGISNSSALTITGTAQLTGSPFVGTPLQYLTVDIDGNIGADGGAGGINIYNTNGTLTGARTVTMGTDSLTFTGTYNQFILNDANANILFNNNATVSGNHNFGAFLSSSTTITGSNNFIFDAGGSFASIGGSRNFVWNSSEFQCDNNDSVIISCPLAGTSFGGNNAVIIGGIQCQINSANGAALNSAFCVVQNGIGSYNFFLNSNTGNISGGASGLMINSLSSLISAAGTNNIILNGNADTYISGSTSYSLAIGQGAQISSANTFLWNDGAAPVTATGLNTFNIVATNGIALGGVTPQSGVDVLTSFGKGVAVAIDTAGGATGDNPNCATYQLTGNSTFVTIPVVLSGSTNYEGRQYMFVNTSGLAFGSAGVTFSTDDGSLINGSPTLVVSSVSFGAVIFQSISGNWYTILLPN